MGRAPPGSGLTEADFRGERFADHPRDSLGNPDLLNLTRPDVVRGDPPTRTSTAGADIATTNTFTATSIGQADYGLEEAVYEMNVAGARLAREAAGDRRVRRGLGRAAEHHALAQPARRRPGYRTHTFDQVRRGLREQIRGLADGGVDLLLIETIFDTLNARRRSSPRARSRRSCRSGSASRSSTSRGRTLTGQTIEAFWASIEHADPLIVGVNCSLGAKEMRPYVADLARIATCLTSLPPERRAAERVRRLRRDARGDVDAPARVRRGRLPERRRRLLRLDARAHAGDRGGRARVGAPNALQVWTPHKVG